MARSQAVLSNLQQARGRRGHHGRGPLGGARDTADARAHHTTESRRGAPSWGGSREREEHRGAVAVPRRCRWSFGVSHRPAGAAPHSLGRLPWPWPLPPPGSCCCCGPWVRPAPTPPPTPSDLASTSDSLSPSTGCLGAGDALGALSTDVPAGLDALCAPSATCPSGRRRLPRQVTGGSQPLSTAQYAASKTPDSEFVPREYCGLHVGGGAQAALRTLRDREEAAGRVRGDLPFTRAY